MRRPDDTPGQPVLLEAAMPWDGAGVYDGASVVEGASGIEGAFGSNDVATVPRGVGDNTSRTEPMGSGSKQS